MIKYILKRSGNKELFDPKKITEAIFKASSAVGDPNWKTAKEITNEIVKEVSARTNKKNPDIEEIQDIVEKTLIRSDKARVAKAYILYRKHRAEIRKEKAQVLNKDYIDNVDKHFDINALRVLASRYLRKDEDGNVVESVKELFTRVATHVVIASLLYDKRVYKKTSQKENLEYVPDDFDANKFAEKYSIGEYKLNLFHLSAMKRVFDRFSREGKMKVTWKKFLKYLKEGYFDKYENELNEYYDVMVTRKFLPNTPAIANFGNVLGMGSACFVLGIEDDIEDIMEKLKAAALIFKAGGGVGYNFSHLRPEGDYVKSTGGVASGPVSFMTMYDNMTEVIKQGGIRRGANMGIMNSNHPDIIKFIKSKEGNKALKNFNISVMLMGDFWKYYESKKPYPLVSPRNNKVIGTVDPRQLFDLITYHAWASAEPGVIFYDKVNEYNPFLESLGPIETTNPCGEVLLYPYESCNLGSINLWAFVEHTHNRGAKIDWAELERVTKIASRFLDNVVDMNMYPLPEIEEMTLKIRKTGLGVMGVGDLLYDLGIPYNSKKGLSLMERLMEAVNYYSKIVSIELSKERGPMPMFKKSFYVDGKLPISGFKDKKNWHFKWNEVSKDIIHYGIRNGYTTVVAPTGSISMIAGTSSGIEPVYSAVFEKNVSVGSFYYIDPVFERKMRSQGLMDDDLIKDIAENGGSIKNLSYISDKLKKIFVTSHDISPKDHIRALASFQKWVDSSISKTNNFPFDATVEDVKEAYLFAHKLGCKGITIFRDGSIKTQVLKSVETKKTNKKKRKKNESSDIVKIEDEKSDGLAVYKDASVSKSISLDISPVEYGDDVKQDNEVDALEDNITFNGAVSKCKLCNLE